MRWGLGPVFIYECLANSRRWQTYAIRSIGVAVLLGGIATIAMSRQANNSAGGWRQYAELGESYFYAIIGVELTLVLLAAPAATADRQSRAPDDPPLGPSIAHRRTDGRRRQ